MNFYRIIETNEVVTDHQIQSLHSDEYRLITKKDSELMIDEFWYPDSQLREEKLNKLFNKKFEEHSEEFPDLTKFTQIKNQMKKCKSYIDMYRLIQDFSKLIMRLQYEKWLDETYPK